MEFHFGLDLLDESNEHLLLAVYFRKGGTAYITDDFFSRETREKNPNLYEQYENFLGFEGSWEEVGLKIIELNNFAVSQNTIPPIPDAMRE